MTTFEIVGRVVFTWAAILAVAGNVAAWTWALLPETTPQRFAKGSLTAEGGILNDRA